MLVLSSLLFGGAVAVAAHVTLARPRSVLPRRPPANLLLRARPRRALRNA